MATRRTDGDEIETAAEEPALHGRRLREADEAWFDPDCCCELEPRWKELAEELEEQLQARRAPRPSAN